MRKRIPNLSRQGFEQELTPSNDIDVIHFCSKLLIKMWFPSHNSRNNGVIAGLSIVLWPV
jgi:hypothetical protein